MNSNILIVASKFWPDYSGPAVRIKNLYEILYPGHKIDVVCNSVINNTNKELYLYQFNIFRLRNFTSTLGKILVFLHLFVKLRGLYKYRTIHIFGSSQITASIMLINAFLQRKVVLELVNTDAKPEQFFLGINVTRLQRKLTIVSISEHISHNIDKKKYHNIWTRANPVSELKFSLSNRAIENIDSTRHETNHRYKVLSISKFMPRKNQIFLINVAEKMPSVDFVIAGPLDTEGRHEVRDMSYFEECEKLIEALRLTNVTLLPEFVDTAALMQDSDLYVMPNKGEGLGTPLFEALMCGLPVVVNAEENAFNFWIGGEEKLGSVTHLEPTNFAIAIEAELNNNDIERMKYRRSFAITHAGQSVVTQKYKELLT